MKTKKPRTIGDLPNDVSLAGVRFIYPGDNKKYYWVSQWQKGVWGKKNMSDGNIHPLFCNDLKDALKWRLA